MRLPWLLATLIAAGVTPSPAFAEYDPQSLEIVRVEASASKVRQQLGVLTGHFRYDADTGIAEVETDILIRRRMAALGLHWQVDENATAALRAFAAQGASGLRSIPGFACYRTVEETHEAMDQMVAQYPQLASIVEIGDSWRRTLDPALGYPLRVLRLTNHDMDGIKPILFAMSSMHAREYTPAELMTRFAENLLADYGSDADATWLLDHNEFHLLLQANPDGRKHAEEALLWRKNDNVVDGPCLGGWPGIDLNRNYPWRWNTNGGSSGSTCMQTFRGPRAGSEPETIAVVDYLTTIYPDRRPGDPDDTSIPADPDTQGMFLDMHSYSGLVLWPWGGTGVTGNDEEFIRLGRRLAWFNDYVPQQAVSLYPTDGTTTDFAYGELGLPSFTYELGTAFFQNCSTFEDTVLPDNLASLRYAARSLHAPYRLSAGPDVHGLALSQSRVARGQTVILSAIIDDRRYQPGPGTPSVPLVITGADLYVDSLPWHDDASGLPLHASDGSFDATHEAVELAIDSGTLSPGRRMLVVQGRNADGHVGPPAAIFIEVVVHPLFNDGFETLPES